MVLSPEMGEKREEETHDQWEKACELIIPWGPIDGGGSLWIVNQAYGGPTKECYVNLRQ